MVPIYRIHPAIGLARLGNSPDGFYLAPEAPAALPTDCDEDGNPLLSPDGKSEVPVKAFKDAEGRVKRQAARFQVYVYDDESPEGRPMRRGDPVAGGGNQGKLVDIQWRVWIANKKASWYQFQQLEGEHGYAGDHPLRNADITDPNARNRLIIDPGPRVVDGTTRRAAVFGRDGGDVYATTFPPPLRPESIDTLGELKTDDQGRLLVLGGHGCSGSWKYGDFGQPRIDDYANNDGWFDDTSDGPVMARLVMYMDDVKQTRYVDVEYPAWVVCAYPRYVPEMLDLITLDDAIEDMSIRQLAARTDLYGQSGTFSRPQVVDVHDPGALAHWRAGRLQWNPDHRPWFYRDIWSILFRPDQFTYLTDILQASNAPHNQSTRGTFDPELLGQPPEINWPAVRRCEEDARRRLESGDLFADTLAPVLDLLEKEARTELRGVLSAQGGGGAEGHKLLGDLDGLLTGHASDALKTAVATYVAALGHARGRGGEALRGTMDGTADALSDAAAGAGTTATDTTRASTAAREEASAAEGGAPLDPYFRALRQAGGTPYLAAARDALDAAVGDLLGGLRWRRHARPPRRRAGADAVDTAMPLGGGSGAAGGGGVEGVFARLGERLNAALQDHLRKLHTGRLLDDARRRCIEANTYDPHRPYRQFLFDLLREPGEENRFFAGGSPDRRTHNLPLMPLLAGDNPISNTLPSKFLRLTDYQYYLLRQWAAGLFYNEKREGWANPDPWWPYASWTGGTGRALDRGVLSNVLGGAFCPGGEIGWVARNPSAYWEPYRIKADPAFYAFQETAAQANRTRSTALAREWESFLENPLSQGNDFGTGLQPGDLTKYMSVPWQADFNECSTQPIDVTYLEWNNIYPGSDNDAAMTRAQKVWETLWWPAHRPMQVMELTGVKDQQPSYAWSQWARGIPQTNEGDFKMVTEWWRLGFVIKNPWAPVDVNPNAPDPPPPYISVEATPHHKAGE